LPSVQDDEDSFRRHLEALHAEEIEQRQPASPDDAQRLRNEITQRAFSLALK
jgi:hypothetical protein